MRQLVLLSIALLTGAGALVGCNSNEMIGQQASNPQHQAQQSSTPSDGARRISAAELHDIWEKGQVLVIDTRGEAAFKQGHIPGAIVIVPNEILAKADELPRDKMIVTYCT